MQKEKVEFTFGLLPGITDWLSFKVMFEVEIETMKFEFRKKHPGCLLLEIMDLWGGQRPLPLLTFLPTKIQKF